MANYIGDINHPFYPPQTYGGGLSPFAAMHAAGGAAPAAPAATATGTTGGVLAGTLASDVAKSNLDASGYNTELTNIINELNRSAQQAANAARLGPAGQSIQNQLLSNTAANARGEIAPDVLQQLAMYGAQRGAAGGFGVDSANTNAAVMRALGLTSQGLQTQAGTDYARLLAENPGAPIFSMENLLVSPSTYASAQEAELRRKQEAEQFAKELEYRYYAANLDAAPRLANALRPGYTISPLNYAFFPNEPEPVGPTGPGWADTKGNPPTTTVDDSLAWLDRNEPSWWSEEDYTNYPDPGLVSSSWWVDPGYGTEAPFDSWYYS